MLCIWLLPSVCFGGQFKVTRVFDGDTIKVEADGTAINVRLAGIDAPETRIKTYPGQPYSEEAKKHLSDLILNKLVEIIMYGEGPCKCPLGVVYLDGRDINFEMVKEGLAEVYRGEAPKGFDPTLYLLAEEAAKKYRKGIWSLGDTYISPKSYRKMRKAKEVLDRRPGKYSRFC